MGAEVTKALQHLDFEAPPGSLSVKEARALWARYDMDNDGYLSAAELRNLCADWCEANDIRKPGMTAQDLSALSHTVDKVVAQMLQSFDRNGDGRVSRVEFFEELAPAPAEEASPEKASEKTPDNAEKAPEKAPEAAPATEKPTEKPTEKNDEKEKAAETKEPASPSAAPSSPSSASPPSSPSSPKKGGLLGLFRRASKEAHKTKTEPKPEGNPYAVKLKSAPKPNDFHGSSNSPKHDSSRVPEHSPHLGRSVTEDSARSHHAARALDEPTLTAWAKKLADQEAALEAYALKLAKREAAVVEREAKVGIVSDDPGVTAVMFPPRTPEDEKLQRELLERKRHISMAATAPGDSDASRKAQVEKALAREHANQQSDNYTFASVLS